MAEEDDMQRMIYFDNAATSWPKLPSVINAVTDAMQSAGGNPGRGSHKLASAAGEVVFDCRTVAGEMFGAAPECIVFTLNATHALNIAIKGLIRENSHILLDSFAHNAVYRPVMALRNRGCTAEIYKASGSDEETLASIQEHIRPNTGLIIATHQSNICSKVLPIEKIGQLSAKYGIPFVVDASQSAGHIRIDVENMGITALCMPGHKGLYGPMGCGMLITTSDTFYETLIEGGAGVHSLDVAMPVELPERLEAGTVALPAIAGLRAGMEWVRKHGIENIHHHEKKLASYFVQNASAIPGIEIIGSCDGSVISFRCADVPPSIVGEKLNQYGICTRTGYHCAPLAHKTLGTMENGTVRLGFSYANRISEIDTLLDILKGGGI